MDNDWLCEEDEVNESHEQSRVAANEQKKLAEQQYNAGYLEGIEWGEINFKSADI